MSKFLTWKDYNPDLLLDTLIDRKHLRCDAALARTLGVGAPVLSKIRHRKAPITSEMLVRMCDLFDMDLDLLRKIGGIPHTPSGKPQVSQAPVRAEEMQGA